VVATDGKENFVEALKEFSKGDMNARLLEVLCCNGCIMGAGMSRKNTTLFQKRSAVSRYVRARLDDVKDRQDPKLPSGVECGRTFSVRTQPFEHSDTEQIVQVLRRMGKHKPEDELNCGACGYDTCVEHAEAILHGLAESEMCLPYTIEQLKTTVTQLEESNQSLASTKNALMQSEKLASMGQLAAGVAHEVNNPLGVVLMYAHLLLDKFEGDPEMSEDLQMIAQQADRCRRIVSGLLNFARQNKTIYQRTNVVELLEEVIKSVELNDGIVWSIDQLTDNVFADIDRDQIMQCLINLVTNAQGAMPKGGSITLVLEGEGSDLIIRVKDSGFGIPAKNLSKIFDPFFTTKQIGKGTGLGLAVLYGIVKMHHGSVTVDSNSDPDEGPTGTTFTMKLPREE
jgi:two-component system NtrC family sensor kinase